MEPGPLKIYLDQINVCSGTGVKAQVPQSRTLRQSKKTPFTGLPCY